MPNARTTALAAILVASSMTSLEGAHGQQAAGGCTVLDAFPSTRVRITDEEVTREVANRTPDVLNARVTIIRAGDTYLYASREHRELFYSRSGVYHTFLDPLSMSTVKIVSGNVPLLGAGLLSEDELHDGFRFVETLSLGLAMLVYFGNTRAFEPNCQ